MIRMLITGACLSLAATGCTKNDTAEGGGASQVADLSVSGSQALSEVKDAASARAEAKSRGYLTDAGCQGTVKGGEVVMFSTSMDLTTEHGQASGVLVKKDDGVYFEQKANHLHEGADLLPPGMVAGSKLSGWEFSSYLGLVCRTVFELKGAKAGTYDKVSAAIVSIEGGAAGIDMSYKDVLEVKLVREVSQDKRWTLSVYLAKGVGPVALHYTERTPYRPELAAMRASQDGTFNLYIEHKGGTGIGDGPSASQALKKQMADCGKTDGRWSGNWQYGRCVTKAEIDGIAKQTKECTDAGGDWRGDWAYGSCYTAKQKAKAAYCGTFKSGQMKDENNCWVLKEEAKTEADCKAIKDAMWYGICWATQAIPAELPANSK